MTESNNKIAVFPASGALGGSTVSHLLNLLQEDASRLILISRHPQKAQIEAVNSGATIRKGDYLDENSLRNVFEGASTLFLVSYPSIEYKFRFNVHKRAIDAARKSGIRHIFYSSLLFGTSFDTVSHVMKAHIQTEQYLNQLSIEDKSFTYTAIREGLYSESFPYYLGFFDVKNPSSEIRIPHDGHGNGISWAKVDELGEATAKLILKYVHNPNQFEYINKFVALSGPRSMTLQQTANIVGKHIGKEIRIHQVSIEEYCNQPQVVSNSFYGGKMASKWATSFDGIRKNETNVATPVLRELLGREPESFEETVAKMTETTK